MTEPDTAERASSTGAPASPDRAAHPPLKLRPKRRVLFPDMIEIRMPRRRPKPPPPAEPITPARLPTIEPGAAVPPTSPPPAAPTSHAAAPTSPPVAAPSPPVVLPSPQLTRTRTRTPTPLPPPAASPSRQARAAATAAPPIDEAEPNERPPMYCRLLRLRYIRPNGWLRALFVEGSVGLAVVLVLAEKASVWAIIAVPVLVAVLVKANDLIAGALQRNR